MSNLLIQAQLVETPELSMRAAVVAAMRGIENPREWVEDRMYKIVSEGDWATVIDGSDMDLTLITDSMVIEAVNSVIENEPEPEPEIIEDGPHVDD